MTHFHIITLFPEAIRPYLDASILGRAQKDGRLEISYYNPRDYTDDKWKKQKLLSVSSGPAKQEEPMPEAGSRRTRVDRRPYGGGPGMVLEAESILKAAAAAAGRKKNVEYLFFSPSGKQFDSAMAKQFSKKKHIVLICGRYEGVDARVVKILKAKPISVGPYVLTGGELPAATVIDATARYIEGVLGKGESREDERVASPDVYTRPEVLEWKGKKHRVPKVLLSGHHAKMEEWRSAKLAKSPARRKGNAPKKG